MEKITFKKLIGHVHQVLLHKFWVFIYCCKFGIIWRGITHDLSKFSWAEFWPSVRYYQKGSSPIPRLHHEANEYRPWFHHRGRNDHHSEYWHKYDTGAFYAVKMPFDCVLEQLADWMGSTKAYGRQFDIDEEIDWLQSTSFYMMHEKTLQLTLTILKEMRDNNLNLKKLRDEYNKT